MRDSDRGNKFSGRRDGGRGQMFQAVCSQCGKNCEVPFQPSGDKPVYCSVCFEQRGGASAQRSGGRDFGRPGRSDFRDREKRMFTAICDKCGKQCEVPFRPTEGKPVFCDACFTRPERDNNGAKREGPTNAEQLTALNAKLDTIMKALTAAGLITAPKKEEKAKEVKAAKEPAAKKSAPAKKKAAPKKKK